MSQEGGLHEECRWILVWPDTGVSNSKEDSEDERREVKSSRGSGDSVAGGSRQERRDSEGYETA